MSLQGDGTNGAQRRDYVVITGHGRSGSNRLLDAFDCHPRTFCRNEANSIAGTALNALTPGFFPSDDPAVVEKWRAAVDQSFRILSVRDRIGKREKTYVPSVLRRRFGREVLSRRTGRKALSLINPQLGALFWPATFCYADKARLEAAYPILKLHLCSGMLLDVAPHEPAMRIVLNVRSAKSFIRSWRHRYVQGKDPEFVFGQNLHSLDRILERFGRNDPAIRAYSDENLIKSELWRWRYVNETLYAGMRASPQFMAVTYEQFDADPAATAAALYAFAGLEMSDETAREVGALQNSLFRDKVADHPTDSLIDDAVDEVLEGSILLGLWDDQSSPAGRRASA